MCDDSLLESCTDASMLCLFYGQLQHQLRQLQENVDDAEASKNELMTKLMNVLLLCVMLLPE